MLRANFKASNAMQRIALHFNKVLVMQKYELLNEIW